MVHSWEFIVNLRKKVNLQGKRGIQIANSICERERESEIHPVNWKLVREKDSESINPGAH